MCGRYTLRTPLTVLSQQFLFDLGGLPADLQIAPRYNIAPTQTICAVRRVAGGSTRELALLHWGLIPAWAKDAKMSASMINARAETLAEKPAFRSAFARRRCLVLADGYFEWRMEGKQKLPLYFRRQDEQPFAFAGLWESWRGPEGGSGPPLESATIVTTAANALSANIHDRMPAILAPENYDAWLDLGADRHGLLDLLRPYPPQEMKVEPVGTRVNSFQNDDPECIAVQETLF